MLQRLRRARGELPCTIRELCSVAVSVLSTNDAYLSGINHSQTSASFHYFNKHTFTCSWKRMHLVESVILCKLCAHTLPTFLHFSDLILLFSG